LNPHPVAARANTELAQACSNVLRSSSSMDPFAGSDRDDFPEAVDEAVAGVAAMVDELVAGLEDSVREPVVADELPDVLDRDQLG